MSTQARSPSEHYRESERLLEVAESPTIDPGIRDLSARLALGHALLTLAPRRARRRVQDISSTRPAGTLPPGLSWGDE